MTQTTKGAQRRGRPVRGAILAVAAVATSVSLAACGADPAEKTDAGPPTAVSQAAWDKVVAAAEKEGEVVLYSSLSDTEATFAEFEKKYPKIDVKIERTPTADLITRIDQEIEVDTAGADVALHSESGWFKARSDQDRFASLKISPGQAAADWETKLDGASYPFVFSNAYVIGYNTKTAEPVKNMNELLTAAKSKRVGIIEAEISPAQTFLYNEWQEAFGDDYLKSLSALKHTNFSSNVPLAQSLAAGELDYGVGLAPSTLVSLKEQGASVDYIIPDEANAGIPYHAAVLASAPHSNAAQVLVDWMMSEDGAKVIAKNHPPAWTPIAVDGSISKDALAIPEENGWDAKQDEDFVESVWGPSFG